MASLNNILEGWGKALGLLDVSPENRELSKKRMAICADCPFASESTFLKFIQGDFKEMGSIICTKCGCPVNEKSLVIDEYCPLGKW